MSGQEATSSAGKNDDQHQHDKRPSQEWQRLPCDFCDLAVADAGDDEQQQAHRGCSKPIIRFTTTTAPK